jgi:beta-aspartyl-peptidase (threonine type)
MCSAQNIYNLVYHTDFKGFIVISAMVEPVVLVHGGAGDIPDSRVAPKLAGVRRAARRGYEVLCTGGSVIDAVEAAVHVMEDDEHFNAGVGYIFMNVS